MVHDVGTGGGGSAPLREVSLPMRPAWPPLTARTSSLWVSLKPTLLEKERCSVFCHGPLSRLYWYPVTARPLPSGWFQVQDTVLSPTPLLLLPVTLGAKARPYGLTELDGALAS